MSIYILPALLALIIKLSILALSYRGKGQSTVFITMVLILALHNLCEVLGFIEFFNGTPADYLFRFYYTASLWVAVFMLLYAIEVSRFKMKEIKATAVIVAASLSVTVLYTDIVVAGSESLGYTLTVVKGPHYWLFQVFISVTLLSILPVLVIGYKKASEHIVEIQCVYTFLALLPLMFVGLGVIILMGFGIKLNASAILPIASTLFLIVTLKSEYHLKLTDVRRFIPMSPERQTSNEILDVCSRYSRDEISYRDGINEIERLLVLQKYKKNGGNASATAELMGMPRSSLYSIFNRLKIESRGK